MSSSSSESVFKELEAKNNEFDNLLLSPKDKKQEIVEEHKSIPNN